MNSANYIALDTPLVVTSFAYTVDEKPERIYYIVKQRDSEVFLKRTMRATAKSSWTTKLKKAALFDDANKAADFLKRVFVSVNFDL